MKLLRAWIGPMSAAKTTGALHAARRYARQGQRVVLIRPTRSQRAHEGSDGRLRTKDGTVFDAVNVQSAKEIFINCVGYDVVWVDEPALFDDEELLFDEVVTVRNSSIVLVSGLGATSEMTPFGMSMPRLLSVADEIIWNSADCDVCRKHGNATRTLFIGEKKSGNVLVGGAETYCPACPECWTRITTAAPTERERLLSELRH